MIATITQNLLKLFAEQMQTLLFQLFVQICTAKLKRNKDHVT